MTSSTYRLLDLDPELGSRLSPSDLVHATQTVRVDALTVHRGPWDPEDDRRQPDRAVVSLLLLTGVLTRRLDLGRRSSMDLAGPGDLVRPWDMPDDDLAVGVPLSVTWRALQETRCAVIDRAALASAGRFPLLIHALFHRGSDQTRAMALRLTVNQIARLEDRVLLTLWFLAQRWGRVTAEGLLVPWDLTHGMLASLVGARRPSVSKAIGNLTGDGRLARNQDGWLLVGAYADILSPVLARVGATLD